ncbi:hypothetical protein [Micromonospora sp. WMMD812]|uniref:hypothetical protein n=1 Tax=Micromonospora sp. WMMD812 TaxID=3015152 RepID=UPI00248AE4BA|nr:hypothetical protein [Micromonospora sp. WMMD812]WBB69164.1 hypothetical protein O7603_07395 [Micromonospora sp. WMMD812]
MNQQIFDEHIGTAPPSTVDVDRIIQRQRRRSLVRRMAGGGSAFAATGLAIAVGIALSGGAQPEPGPPVTAPAVSASAGASASPSAPTSGLRLDTSDPKAIQQTLDQLRVALETAVAGAAPDVRWIYMPDVPGEKRLPDGHPAMYAERDPVGLAARSGVARQGKKAGLYMWVRPDTCSSPGSAGPDSDSGPRVCSLVFGCDPMKPSTCQASTTPEGLEVVETTETSPAKNGKQYRFYQVQVKLPQGYYLRLLAVNYFGGDGSGVTSDTPLLTKAELRTAATAIAAQVVS